jgi:hypothetical protein
MSFGTLLQSCKCKKPETESGFCARCYCGVLTGQAACSSSSSYWIVSPKSTSPTRSGLSAKVSSVTIWSVRFSCTGSLTSGTNSVPSVVVCVLPIVSLLCLNRKDIESSYMCKLKVYQVITCSNLPSPLLVSRNTTHILTFKP